jgi:hypothetical protein
VERRIREREETSLPPPSPARGTAPSSTRRALPLLDGTLARLAAALQMEITDYDTTPGDAVAELPAMSGGRA